jgi:septal ring factor EnvC (AmiA/AmiB activator)
VHPGSRPVAVLDLRPKPKPLGAASTRAAASDDDLSRAVPLGDEAKLPSTAQQYKRLQSVIAKATPAVKTAKQKSDALAAQASQLRTRLMTTAARVQDLERERSRLDVEIAKLQAEDAAQSAAFARDRVAVSHLLGILERLQYDMPPAMAVRPNDALGAARGAMLIGASVPRVYGAAASLALRIKALRETRLELVTRRAEGVRNATQLTAAEKELDRLLAIREREAAVASSLYGDLQSKLDTVAKAANDLSSLIRRVAALRRQPGSGGMVVVGPINGSALGTLHKDSLLNPAVGGIVPGGIEGLGGAGAPGVTFITDANALVIAPTDGKVLFAGPYHKTGQVLILESPGGYDLVLAGLDRIAVRPNDQLLAGEPLGTMPRMKDARLYFELRQNGKGISPAPYLSVALRKAKKS